MSTRGDQGPVWTRGVDRIILDRCESTMAEAAARVPMLDRPTWIMAKEQTGGRGRQGRPWIHPTGNLAATLVWRPEATPQEAAKRSFLAANALFEALSHFVLRDALSVKWPNDVLLNEGKVAGILLESSGTGPFVDWLAVGVGVNLSEVPEGVKDAAFPPVSLLDEGGEAVTPQDFLTVLADCYATQEMMLERLGFGRIRDDWLRRAARLGEIITARTPKGDVTGIFDSVNEEGALVLITGSGPKAISAADIFF